MKKIVQVGLDVTPSAGGSTAALHWIRDALGGEAISFTGSGRWDDIHEGDGVLHLRMGCGLLGRLFHKPETLELRRADEVLDGVELLIVHTLYRYHAHWAREQACRRGIPYWVLVHGGLDPYVLSYRRFRKMRWLRHFGQGYLRGAERVLFATRRERGKAAPFLDGVATESLLWPVEPVSPANSGKSRVAWRKEFGIGARERLLLYLGRLQKAKRPIEIIEAFRLAEASNLHLVLAGPGETYSPEDLRHLVQMMGVNRVHVLGPVYRWRKDGLLFAADGLISLSAKENFNLAATEAMSAGRPVILSPGNDLQDELDGTDCGWLLESDDLAEAVHAIREFAQLPEDQLAAKGGAARDWVTANLGFENFRHRLESLASCT